tara:strand:- start:308 stop:613 length:306 start_codon:yes stop_codon:yes gene_type:complete
MDWDVYVKNKQDDGTKNSHEDNGEQSFFTSELTLHLSHLGKLTAIISIHNGRMRIGFLAEQPKALQLLKTKSALLAKAIESNGQTIESLVLNNTMEVAQDG